MSRTYRIGVIIVRDEAGVTSGKRQAAEEDVEAGALRLNFCKVLAHFSQPYHSAACWGLFGPPKSHPLNVLQVKFALQISSNPLKDINIIGRLAVFNVLAWHTCTSSLSRPTWTMPEFAENRWYENRPFPCTSIIAFCHQGRQTGVTPPPRSTQLDGIRSLQASPSPKRSQAHILNKVQKMHKRLYWGRHGERAVNRVKIRKNIMQLEINNMRRNTGTLNGSPFLHQNTHIHRCALLSRTKDTNARPEIKHALCNKTQPDFPLNHLASRYVSQRYLIEIPLDDDIIYGSRWEYAESQRKRGRLG